MATDPHGAAHTAPPDAYEKSDATLGPLIRFAVFLTIVTVGCALLMIGFYNYLDAREEAEKAPRFPLAVGQPRGLPPPPRLQSYPFQDVKDFRAQENQILDRYAWVDRNGGVVRIPVSRAIEILAGRGLPVREAPPAEPAPPAAGDTAPAEAAPAPPPAEH